MSFLDAFGLGDPFDPRRMAQPRRQPLPSPSPMQFPQGRPESATTEPDDGQQRFTSMVAALAKGDDADPKSALAKVERILAGMPRREPFVINEDPYAAAATRVPAMSPTDGPDNGEPNPNRAPPNVAEFVKLLLPHVQSAVADTGIDPRLALAQAALETGYGRAAPGNNYFGIKGPGQVLGTKEAGPGGLYDTRASFRSYKDPSESVRDYINLLVSNPRYAPVLAAKTLEDQIAAMGKSGYATDPQYAEKLRRVANSLPTFARGGFFSRGK